MMHSKLQYQYWKLYNNIQERINDRHFPITDLHKTRKSSKIFSYLFSSSNSLIRYCRYIFD